MRIFGWFVGMTVWYGVLVVALAVGIASIFAAPLVPALLRLLGVVETFSAVTVAVLCVLGALGLVIALVQRIRGRHITSPGPAVAPHGRSSTD